MNRSWYFCFIEEKLTTLATRVESRGKLNILDLNIHSENFYLHFFNLLFDWKLENENAKLQNTPAIDLIDRANKIFIQVSAINRKDKIEGTLTKDILKDYSDYNFKFICISKDAANLRTKTFVNPYGINFDPKKDIYELISILNIILSLDIDKQREIYDFIKKELRQETDIEKLDSNLTTIVNILAKENLNESSDLNAKTFEIEKKIAYNGLKTTKITIEDYKIHHNRLEKIYSEFNKQGANKSISVLQNVRQEYVILSNKFSDDELFLKIKDSIIEKIRQSANFVKTPIDELELCVNIILVDAFIRCKIFKNPENYNYANS
ncbi:MAG: SMEK domain-containing protein [Chitinophagales bacterium]|nr:SMEK domain-containing protein [Chitinophagales bacterium]